MKKQSPKTLRSLKAKAWKLFSIWIRRRDADEGGTVACYTCGRLAHWSELHAGHFVGGRTNAVLFDERVVRPQCVACNIFLGGNYAAYTLRMLDENGRSTVDELLALKRQTKKYTRSDLLDLIERYQGKINELEAMNAM